MDRPGRGDGTKRLKRLALLTAVSAVGSLALAVPLAHSAPGDLLYQGCLSGNPLTGSSGTNACAQAPVTGTNGNNSGFDQAWGTALSPDGASLYVLSHEDDAILRFSRNTSTGALTYQDCLSAETESGPIPGGSGACALISGASSNGTLSPMDQPYGIVISSNGASVYVTAEESDTVIHFSRNTGNGALTLQECITGNSDHTTSGCTEKTASFSAGTNSGLDKVRAIAIDANGEAVYTTSGPDDAIARFTRDSGTGDLTYVDCQTVEEATGPTPGNGACTALPGINNTGGGGSGFDNPQALAVSPNGASVYAASANDAAITRFNRTAVTGVIARQDCLTRETAVVTAGCAQVPGGTANGTDSGFDNFRAMVVTPNGASLYGVAGGDSAISHFSRDTGTGALNFQSCLTGESQIGPPPGSDKCSTQVASATPNGDQSGWAVANNGPALAINAAGTAVYFGTGGDDSVVQLDRDTASGGLTFRRCLTTETESAPGCVLLAPSASFGLDTALNSVNGLALSGDARSVYATSANSDAVATLSVEQAPAVTPPAAGPPGPTGQRAAALKRCKKKFAKGTKKRKKCVKRAKKLPV